VVTEPGNGGAAWPVLGDGEGGLRSCFGSKDVCQGFLELPSSFSTDQLLRSVLERIGKGINAVSNEWLNVYDNGFGSS
jgi:hypothetical protein